MHHKAVLLHHQPTLLLTHVQLNLVPIFQLAQPFVRSKRAAQDTD